MAYANANIPVLYWTLDLAIEFKGSQELKDFYQLFTTDLLKSYRHGKSYCLAGPNGVGKTMTCTSILKRVIEKSRYGLYLTLSDLVASTKLPIDEAYQIRKELLTIDFLILDEFDPRYIGSDASADFFGRMIEELFRCRLQNCLPTIFCSNSSDPLEGFKGEIKKALKSLMYQVEIIPLAGKDFRKEKKS